jgi:hypothetical protein
VGTTGAVFAGPASPIEVVCSNMSATQFLFVLADDLTATTVNTVNGHAAARPAHRPIANRIPIRPRPGLPAARHARSQTHH